MKKGALEPAFPRDHVNDGHNGMTLRDYFAAKAMQGYMGPDYDMSFEGRARSAYQQADAMLEERKK